MAKEKVRRENEFFQVCLEMPLDELEDLFWNELGYALGHFRVALRADQVVYLRKYCVRCPSAKPSDLEMQMEPCPKCDDEHATLGNLDNCILTHVSAFALQKFLYHLEQSFQENWPLVYPAFIRELRAMQARLGNPEEWSSSEGIGGEEHG